MQCITIITFNISMKIPRCLLNNHRPVMLMRPPRHRRHHHHRHRSIEEWWVSSRVIVQWDETFSCAVECHRRQQDSEEEEASEEKTQRSQWTSKVRFIAMPRESLPSVVVLDRFLPMHFSFVILRMISKRNWPIPRLGKWFTRSSVDLVDRIYSSSEISKVVAHMWENIEPEVKEVSDTLRSLARSFGNIIHLAIQTQSSGSEERISETTRCLSSCSSVSSGQWGRFAMDFCQSMIFRRQRCIICWVAMRCRTIRTRCLSPPPWLINTNNITVEHCLAQWWQITTISSLPLPITNIQPIIITTTRRINNIVHLNLPFSRHRHNSSSTIITTWTATVRMLRRFITMILRCTSRIIMMLSRATLPMIRTTTMATNNNNNSSSNNSTMVSFGQPLNRNITRPIISRHPQTLIMQPLINHRHRSLR